MGSTEVVTQGLSICIWSKWKIKAQLDLVVVEEGGPVTPKLGKWLQQIPGRTSEPLSKKVQCWEQPRSYAKPSNSQASNTEPEMEEDNDHP